MTNPTFRKTTSDGSPIEFTLSELLDVLRSTGYIDPYPTGKMLRLLKAVENDYHMGDIQQLDEEESTLIKVETLLQKYEKFVDESYREYLQSDCCMGVHELVYPLKRKTLFFRTVI